MILIDGILGGVLAFIGLEWLARLLRPTPPEVIAAQAEERRAKDLAEIAKHSTKVKI